MKCEISVTLICPHCGIHMNTDYWYADKPKTYYCAARDCPGYGQKYVIADPHTVELKKADD